jgi:TIR domain
MANKQVFISHISAETEIAKRLKQRLDNDFLGMLEIFVSSDRETIRAGEKWLDQVNRALKAADAEVVLCSKESVGRPWVNFEAGAAWLRGIPVIPVCHSGLSLVDLPVPLNMLQGIECSSPDGLHKLYDAMAAVLGVKTPAVDFQAMAADMRQLEETHRMAATSIERVENPRILCAASAQYAQPSLGFHLDVAVLEQVFGKQRVVVERALSRRRLSELLSSQRFDLVHLVTGVDARTGDVVFSDMDLHSGLPSTAKVDKLSPAELAKLLAESQTRLVVLATCRALKLAVVLARSLNMVGTEEEITGEQAAEWADCFYNLLRQGQALHKAFDLASSQVDTPLLLVPHRDVVFALPQP